MQAQPVILAIDQLTLEASDFQSLNSGLPFTIDAATSYQFFLKTPVDAPLDKRIQATQQQLTSYLQEQLITIAKTPMTLTRLESLTETEQTANLRTLNSRGRTINTARFKNGPL
ncbi:hypothetical protein QY886_09100 [Latilactobacillus sakei]